jgi:hypothetical protein
MWNNSLFTNIGSSLLSTATSALSAAAASSSDGGPSAWSLFPQILPASLQRKVVTYILRRTLGHLLKDGQIDERNIEAGRLEVRFVQLDADVSVNATMKSPFHG